MKTIVALALTLVLTACLLVGCGCTNQNIDNTSAPTVLPTNEEIWNTTEAATRPTTAMTTEPTMTTGSEPTDNGNQNDTGSTDSTASTEDTMGSRARRMMPQSK